MASLAGSERVPAFDLALVRRVIHRGLLLVTTVYVLFPLAAYVLFGDATRGDVLLNFSSASLAPVIGRQVCRSRVYGQL